MTTHQHAAELHERIRAVGLLAGDGVERLLRDSLALLNSVTHADLASFLARLDAIQVEQGQIHAALDALAQQHATLLQELRAHHQESAAYRAGQAVAVATLEERIVAVEEQRSVPGA